MANQKKLGVNFIYSVLKTLMGVVFPLITFPYATRVLGPACLGKIDYAYANVSYFVLIASFGISGYAIREGSRYRDDKEKISKFASELLCINVITIIIAYVLFLAVLLLPKLRAYRGLMLLFSVTIFLTPLGVEWIYNIFEEYRYITVRAFMFQIAAVVLLFTCVKNESDYMVYAITLILSSVGSNVVNILRLRKYVDVRFSFHRGILRHVKPMFYLFIMAAASSIYLVMDRSMLGYITQDDKEVGLYTTAVKVVTVLTSLIASIRTVVIPRSAYYIKSNPEKSKELNYITLKIVCMLSIPCAIGISLLSERVMVLFAGKAYAESAAVLQILMFDLVFSVVNGVLINQFFIINKKDRLATVAIVCGAVANLILNSILIPEIGKYGAAISTCISELVIFTFACLKGRDIIRIEKAGKQVGLSLVACIPMVGIFLLAEKLGLGDIGVIAVTVAAGAASYFAMLLLMKNELVQTLLQSLRRR